MTVQRTSSIYFCHNSDFEIGVSSRLRQILDRHEEQNWRKILYLLDELSLVRIELIEVQNHERRTQKAAIKKLVVDSVTAALEAQAATMAGTVRRWPLRGLNENPNRYSLEECVEENNVTFALVPLLMMLSLVELASNPAYEVRSANQIPGLVKEGS
ncbi:hypothetical protein Tco_0621586 [Tanacetum coccineum]